MKTFLLGLGCQYSEKPNDREIVRSKKRAVENYAYYDLSEAADMIGNQGYSFMPEYLEGGMKQENFVSMQMFPIDFDGEKFDKKTGKTVGNNITFGEVKARADRLGLQIAFAYRTLSCPDGPGCYKFRVVFITDQTIYDRTIAAFIYKILGKIFPECDAACTEISRMFLGGKGLIYEDDPARVTMVQLTHSLYQCLDKNGNLIRNLHSFMKKNGQGIAVINNLIAVGTLDMASSIFDEKCESYNPIILKVDSGFSSIFYIREKDVQDRKLLHHSHTCKKHRWDLAQVCEKCQLLMDFANDQELDHMERFLLATNLNCITNGLNWFYERLESSEVYAADTIQHWYADRNTIKRYHPTACSEICRYYEECSKYGEFKNIVSKYLQDNHVYINRKIDYGTEEAASQELQENLEEAFLSTTPGIHLIRGQTGIGKTRSIQQLIHRYPNKRFLIAEPINKKKQEIYHDLKWGCESIACTASVRESRYLSCDEICSCENLHQQGEHKEARQIVIDHLKRIQEGYPKPNSLIQDEIDECNRILGGVRACMDCNVVITTHAMLVNLNENILKSFDAIIIDEDVLYLQILNNIKTVSRSTLEQLAEKRTDTYASIARKMLEAEEKVYYKANWSYRYIPEWNSDAGRNEYQDEYYDDNDSIIQSEMDNINDLAKAGSYVCEDGIFYYFCVSELPKMKYIVLTATCDADIYRDYFGGWLPVKEYSQTYVPYTGTLKQFTYYSLGRSNLEKHQCVYDFIKTLPDGEKINIISFKSEERKRRLNNHNIHFGNAIGVNVFSGKDLAIVGTPYKNPKAYLLPCCYMYGESVTKNQQMYRERVTYKDNSFLIMAFPNEKLFKYEMYSIESELEQCIGRARLLRQDCTVYLFSAFPCEQAEIISDDYLSIYAAEGPSSCLS